MQGLSDIRRSGQLALAAADAAILVASGFVAAWVRFGDSILERELGLILDHPGFIAYALLAQLVLAVTFDLYRPQSWRTRDYLLTRMAALGISLAVALALGTYLVLGWRFGRGLLAITLVISVTAQTVLRFAWYIAAARVPARRAVLIGEGPIVAELQQVLAERSAPRSAPTISQTPIWSSWPSSPTSRPPTVSRPSIFAAPPSSTRPAPSRR